MGFVSMTMGANVKTDLIDSLGDEWVIYTDPTVGGNGFVGGALVNRLRDAQREEQALGAMEVAFNNVVASRMKNEKMTIAIRTTERDGLTIHYLAFPIVSPAWAIRDGNLYVGLYPQVVAGSAAFVKSGGKSILENPQFQAARKGLPGADEAKQTSGVSFVDLPRTAASAYPMWLMISRYAGFADLFGVQSPPMLLPPLASIQGHLTPAASASWWDATGRHSVGTSPFPMSGTMASDPTQMTVAAPAVMMSVLLPSLNRARETANRVKCGSNLRQMGQGMFLYSNEHKGKLPPDMGTIVLTQELGPEVFICPSGNNALPANWREMQPDEVAAWINKNADYVYLGKGKTNSESPETILIYEKTDAHGGDGMNILFGDGHVEFLRHDAARKEILKQTGKDIGGAGEEPVGAQPGAGQPGAP
jgi:prepilin-type processing-associated H-X9-DG protein